MTPCVWRTDLVISDSHAVICTSNGSNQNKYPQTEPLGCIVNISLSVKCTFWLPNLVSILRLFWSSISDRYCYWTGREEVSALRICSSLCLSAYLLSVEWNRLFHRPGWLRCCAFIFEWTLKRQTFYHHKIANWQLQSSSKKLPVLPIVHRANI